MHNAALQRLIHDSPVIAFFSATSLFCCALLVYAAAPQWFMYKERVERVRYYDTYISSSDGFDAMRRELELKNESLAFKFNSIVTDMPPHSISDILQQLIRHGNESGVVLAKIQPQAEIELADARYVPVFLEVRADYHKLGRYIASLEALPQILRIRQVAIETTRGGGLNARLLVNCLIAQEGGG